jgi:hypothetical protein
MVKSPVLFRSSLRLCCQNCCRRGVGLLHAALTCIARSMVTKKTPSPQTPLRGGMDATAGVSAGDIHPQLTHQGLRVQEIAQRPAELFSRLQPLAVA